MVNDGMGYFWFLDSYSVDLFVSVLDLMGVDGNFWVFAGGLSNVVYTLRVTDTQTGVVKTYFNPLGSFIVITDTTAFLPIPKSTRERKQLLPFLPSLAQLGGSVSDGFKGLTAASPVAGGCTVGPTTACLRGGRFQVSVEWKDFVANSGSGQTAAGIQTNDSSGFSFFEPFIDLVVKILDGGPVNGNFWFFYAALTNVEYPITVTDTVAGVTTVYRSELGISSSVGDNGTPDLVLTKDAGLTDVSPGDAVTYTIVVCNPKPSLLQNDVVSDLIPAELANSSWMCTASTGSSCNPGLLRGNIMGTVTIRSGCGVTYILAGTVALIIARSLVKTASIVAPLSETKAGGSTVQATDINAVIISIPTLSQWSPWLLTLSLLALATSQLAGQPVLAWAGTTGAGTIRPGDHHWLTSVLLGQCLATLGLMLYAVQARPLFPHDGLSALLSGMLLGVMVECYRR